MKLKPRLGAFYTIRPGNGAILQLVEPIWSLAVKEGDTLWCYGIYIDKDIILLYDVM